MGVVSLFGRVLFCSIFVISALNRLLTVTHTVDPTMSFMEPKLAPLRNTLKGFIADNAYASELSSRTQFDVDLHLSSYNLNIAAIVLELLGSLLFIGGSRHGARMLLLHLMAVTPIMHNFYAIASTGSPEWQNEFVMFMKNFAMMGGLIMFLAEEGKNKRNPMLMRSSAPRTTGQAAYGIKKTL